MIEFKIGNSGENVECEIEECEIEGTIAEITTDLIVAIGLVHQWVKEKSSEDAAALRSSVEHFLTPGTIENKSIFEHFNDYEWLRNEKEKKKNKKKTKDDIMKLFEELVDFMAEDNDD